MFTTRFGEICRDRDPLEEAAHHDQIGPARRQWSKIARLKSSCVAKLLRSITTLGMPAVAGELQAAGGRAAGDDQRDFHGQLRRPRIFSMKLRSVVPPPEIRTAMRKGARRRGFPTIGHAKIPISSPMHQSVDKDSSRLQARSLRRFAVPPRILRRRNRENVP